MRSAARSEARFRGCAGSMRSDEVRRPRLRARGDRRIRNEAGPEKAGGVDREEFDERIDHGLPSRGRLPFAPRSCGTSWCNAMRFNSKRKIHPSFAEAIRRAEPPFKPGRFGRSHRRGPRVGSSSVMTDRIRRLASVYKAKGADSLSTNARRLAAQGLALEKKSAIHEVIHIRKILWTSETDFSRMRREVPNSTSNPLKDLDTSTARLS